MSKGQPSEGILKLLRKDEQQMMSTGFFRRHWSGAMIVLMAGAVVGLFKYYMDGSPIVENVSETTNMVLYLILGLLGVTTLYSFWVVPSAAFSGFQFMLFRKYLNNRKAIYPAISEFVLAGVSFLWISFYMSMYMKSNMLVGAGVSILIVLALVLFMALFGALMVYMVARSERNVASADSEDKPE